MNTAQLASRRGNMPTDYHRSLIASEEERRYLKYLFLLLFTTLSAPVVVICLAKVLLVGLVG